ncbi:E3 ubiquitin-protein ligase RSL1-like [Bidens hawaiensis]|uniref:E3 ubiquitin-protein ligase RSL1-like n=1 Tax=Bidens hawaiensis TaxID=980011 RepID=UPI00404B57AE
MIKADTKQLQEDVLASQNSTCRSSSSLLKRVMCEICFEDHESCQMFKNSTCSHSFCNICTSKHATTKIQANNKTIACPGINCNSTLDSNTMRPIIPKQTLIKWDEYLCESAIPESHKLYCPFTNCSALLINKRSFLQSAWSFISNSARKIDCPVCRRSFCMVCQVPWHSKFSCGEFRRKLKKDKTGDKMAVALAKKNKWKKCPECKFFVEKVDGCLHIICRCMYEFCYACGVKWKDKHNRWCIRRII